jgi:hypothetical protein
MKTGYVYFVAYGNEELRKYHPVIKIGMTYNIEKRLANLSTASAIPLILAGFIPSDHPDFLENHLHCRFGKRRLNGEWFKVDAEMLRDLTLMNITNSRIEELFVLDDNITEIEILRAEVKHLERAWNRANKNIDELCISFKKADPQSYEMAITRIFGAH